jgi:sarcosine oxidase subunit beta
MTRTAEVVIVGGGVMGVSIAHHLALAGAGRIVLLEKRHIGAGSSGKSGAIIRQHYSTALLVRMARDGVTTFRDFPSHVQAESGWIGAGCLFIASEKDRAAAQGNVELMRQAGAAAEVRAGIDLTEVFPEAEFADDEIGAWEPEAGCVDAASVLHGYAESARRMGVIVEAGTEVLDIESDRGAIRSVATTGGAISCGTVVLCAGPWARRLAARAGVDLPLSVIRPQVTYFRRPGDFAGEHHPVIGDLRNGFYCRPDAGGRTLAGALDVSNDEIVVNPDNYEEGVSGEFIHWAHEKLTHRIPAMRRAFTRGGYSGLYTLTPDSHPILGESPGVRGLFLAVGFSGHGFKLSPAVGRGLSELITTGAYRTLDLSPLRATRFADNAPIKSAYEYGILS